MPLDPEAEQVAFKSPRESEVRVLVLPRLPGLL